MNIRPHELRKTIREYLSTLEQSAREQFLASCVQGLPPEPVKQPDDPRVAKGQLAFGIYFHCWQCNGYTPWTAGEAARMSCGHGCKHMPDDCCLMEVTEARTRSQRTSQFWVQGQEACIQKFYIED